MHHIFTRMSGENYHRRLGCLLLCWLDALRALINSLACRFESSQMKSSEVRISQITKIFISEQMENISVQPIKTKLNEIHCS